MCDFWGIFNCVLLSSFNLNTDSVCLRLSSTVLPCGDISRTIWGVVMFWGATAMWHSLFCFHTAQDWNPGTLLFSLQLVFLLLDLFNSLQSMALVCTVTFVLWLASRVKPWQKIGSAWTVTAVTYCQWCGWLRELLSPETLTWVNSFCMCEECLWSEWDYLWHCGLQNWILKYCNLMVFLSSVLFPHVREEWWNCGDGMAGWLLLFLVLLRDTVSKNCFCIVPCCYICVVAVTASAIPGTYICYSNCTFHSGFLKTQPNEYNATLLYHIYSVHFIVLWWDNIVRNNTEKDQFTKH